ncbi:TonB-dependent receptor [Sphingobium sp. TomTYG75]
MGQVKYFRLSSSLFALAALTATEAVNAQEAPASSASTGGQLEEIIVTAQKRREKMQDLPVSVTSLSGSALQNLKLTDASQLAVQVPNLTVQTPFGEVQPIFAMRGVSLVDYSQHQQGPIGMYVDEDYKGAGVFRAQQLYDIDRVEVLRGPQGTLFGRNTTGGAVNIYTVQPDLDGAEGFVTAGVGNYGLRELTAAVEFTPVQDVFGIRAAFDGRKSDGYLHAVQPGLKNFANDDSYAFRVNTAFRPSPDLRFNLGYSRSRSDTRPAGYTVTNVGPEGLGFAGIFNQGLGFYDVNAGDQGYLKVDNDSVILRAEWDMSPDVGMTSVTTYDKGRFRAYSDDDSRPEGILADGSDAKARVWSQELRLASRGSGPFTWLLGAAASDEKISSATRYDSYASFSEDVGGTPICLIDNVTGCVYTNQFRMKRRSLSAFGHTTYKFDNGIEVQIGLRYSNDRTDINEYKAYLGYFDPATGAPVYGVSTFIEGPPQDRFTNRNLSGKAALRYRFTNNASVYASFSRGYRSGTFNGYAYFDPAEITIVKPEILDAFEIGAKSELFGRKLRLNGAVYYYKYRNQQFLDVTDQGLEILVNAPRSRIWGAELEAAAAPTRSLTLSAGIGYTNGKFQDLTLSGVVLDGNRLTSAPRWTLNGAVDWKLFQDTDAAFAIHMDARYSSLQYFDAFNTADISQPGYWLVNGRLTKPIGNTGLEIGLWVKNLLKKRYYAYLVDYKSFMNANLATSGAPRTYGADISFRF